MKFWTATFWVKTWKSFGCVLLHQGYWFWEQTGPHEFDWSCEKCGRIWEESDFS